MIKKEGQILKKADKSPVLRIVLDVAQPSGSTYYLEKIGQPDPPTFELALAVCIEHL